MSQNHNMPCSAFLIAFGPEVRAFLYSGFIEECSRGGRAVIITANPDSKAFQNVPWPVILLPSSSENPRLERFRGFAARVAEKRLLQDGYSKWRHYLPENAMTQERFHSIKVLLASQAGTRLMDVCENLMEKVSPPNSAFTRIFREQRVSTLYYSAYGNPRTNAAVVAARRMGIQTVAVPNSWKDFYVLPRVAPLPDKLWVWDEECRDNFLRHNPSLKAGQVVVKSSLHLEAVRRQTGRVPREDFCRFYGLEPALPIACYTTAAPNAVVGEERIVDDLARSLATMTDGRSCQLIVRVNPMEAGSRFEDALGGIPGVAIQRPQWEWQPHSDWCCALEEDASLWAATLEHMAVNLSVPSTVTHEALAFSKPVINICFDVEADLLSHCSVKRFWDAAFYRRFHNDSRVFFASSREQLVDLVTRVLKMSSDGVRP